MKYHITSIILILLFISSSSAQQTEKIINNIIEGNNNVLSIYANEEKNVLIRNNINTKGNSINIHYGVSQKFVDKVLLDLEESKKANANILLSKRQIENYLKTKVFEYK